MARPGRPERNRAARSFGQLRRFHHGINSNKVFGTHTEQSRTKPARVTARNCYRHGGDRAGSVVYAALCRTIPRLRATEDVSSEQLQECVWCPSKGLWRAHGTFMNDRQRERIASRDWKIGHSRYLLIETTLGRERL